MEHLDKKEIAKIIRLGDLGFVKAYEPFTGNYELSPIMHVSLCKILVRFYQEHWCEKRQTYVTHSHTKKGR